MAANANTTQQSSNLVKSPPFYVTIIIGKYLVHNYMIDLGPTILVMPKKIAGQLGLKYETLEKGVFQLDGTAIEMVGIMRNLDLTLHSCPSFSIPMDIYIIDLISSKPRQTTTLHLFKQLKVKYFWVMQDCSYTQDAPASHH